MNFHTNTVGVAKKHPPFAQIGNRLTVVQNIYGKREYPSLKEDRVKITAVDGRSIFVPRSKLKSVDDAEF